jgi:hypothetical protein
MTARLTLVLTLVLVSGLNRPLLADTEPTKADIPKDLPPELKAIAEGTFSKIPATRRQAIVRFSKMGERGTKRPRQDNLATFAAGARASRPQFCFAAGARASRPQFW